MKQTTYTNARANFAALCRYAAEEREPVVINRRGGEDVVLISADELKGLLETAHLLRSPKNAKRLFDAIYRAKTNTEEPRSIESLREELSVGEEE
jgi:antitoxin YefM